MSRTRIDPSLLNNLSSNLNMGSNKIVSLANGSSSNDAAAFGQIPVFTAWASYTPTTTGLGTPTSVAFNWHQMGNHVFVKGSLVTGTVTGATVTISVPSTKPIDLTNSQAAFKIGSGTIVLAASGPTLHTAATLPDVIVDPSGSNSTSVNLSIKSGSGSPEKAVGTELFNNGDTLALFFDYAI